MEFSTGVGALRFAPSVVSCGEERFEADLSFLLCWDTFPGFAVFNKETGLVDDMEDDANDLFEAVWSVTSGGVVTAIFDPVEKGFNWLVYNIRGMEYSVFFCRSAEEMLA